MTPIKTGKGSREPLFITCGAILLLICFGAASAYSSNFSVLPLNAYLLLIGCTTLIWLVCANLVSNVTPVYVIVFFAVVLRLLALNGLGSMDDDIFRYLWDGYANMTFNGAYAGVPMDFFAAEHPEAIEVVIDQLAYPSVSTPYAPVAQLLFSLAYMIDPGAGWPLRCFALLADLLIIFLLANTSSRRNLLLYCWCPVIIFEGIAAAHCDLWALALVFAAYSLRDKQLPLMCAVLVVAVLLRPIAALAIPILLSNRPRQIVFTLSGTAILYFLLANMLGGYEKGLLQMAEHWQFNAMPYTIGSYFFGPVAARLMLLACFGFAYCYIVFAADCPPAEKLLFSFALLILLSPVVNPWYWLWTLPFAASSNLRFPWLVAPLLSLSYINGTYLLTKTSPLWAGYALYQIPTPVFAVEWVLIVLSLFIGQKLIREEKKVHVT